MREQFRRYSGAGVSNSESDHRVAALVERLPGVKRAAVSLDRVEARVEFDDSTVTTECLVQTIGLLGFRARLKTVEDSG